MFTSTRLKLTAWYLLILMAISGLFSLVIFAGINQDYNRLERGLINQAAKRKGSGAYF
jgi:hypothetical protein